MILCGRWFVAAAKAAEWMRGAEPPPSKKSLTHYRENTLLPGATLALNASYDREVVGYGGQSEVPEVTVGGYGVRVDFLSDS